MREHLKQTFLLQSGPIPWSKMFLLGFSAAIPLFIGHLTDNFGTSMLGALFALILGLIDHNGILSKRILHLIYTIIALIISIFIGRMFIDQILFQSLILAISLYLFGKFKNHGVELERMFLFCLLYFITISNDHTFLNNIEIPIKYSLFGASTYLIILLLLAPFRLIKDDFISSKRKSFIQSLENFRSTKFALFYMMTNLLFFLILHFLKIEKSYWALGTSIIVMLPDFYQGLYKSIQRIVGTIIGVVIAFCILKISHNHLVLIAGAFLFAFLTPYGLQRNYWLGNIFIAALIIFFLETNPQNNLSHISITRIFDIFIGGSIAIISMYFYLKLNIQPQIKAESKLQKENT